MQTRHGIHCSVSSILQEAKTLPTINALELEEHLGDAALAPVCALVGEDMSLRSRSLMLLREAGAPADQPGSTIREFEGTPEARDVFDELRTIPFMGLAGRRVVAVPDGDQFLKNCGDRLAAYVAHAPETSTLIIGLRSLANSSVGKAIRATGYVVDCRSPRWRDAEGWVMARAGRMGKSMTPRAASALVEGIGTDLLALENELAKLVAYAASEEVITDAHVEDVVPPARSRSVFDLSHAVGRGDAAEALRLCERLLLRGKSKEGLLAILAREVRNLWEIKRLQAKGAGEKEIAGAMRLPGFVVRRALRVARGLSDDRLAGQLSTLSAADAEMKTTSLRAREERIWLENLLARLCGR
jgi:DNA polymerase-3 subunit delta